MLAYPVKSSLVFSQFADWFNPKQMEFQNKQTKLNFSFYILVHLFRSANGPIFESKNLVHESNRIEPKWAGLAPFMFREMIYWVSMALTQPSALLREDRVGPLRTRSTANYWNQARNSSRPGISGSGRVTQSGQDLILQIGHSNRTAQMESIQLKIAQSHAYAEHVQNSSISRYRWNH